MSYREITKINIDIGSTGYTPRKLKADIWVPTEWGQERHQEFREMLIDDIRRLCEDYERVFLKDNQCPKCFMTPYGHASECEDYENNN